MSADEATQQAARMWSGGEYEGLSERLRPAAQALADACAVGAGQEVLDVAAGDGNFAIACAEEGCAVVASDFAPGMVERGRARSEAEGCDIEWVEADARELPFADDRFECVGSVFGAMFAPDPERTAAELFRVTRPGNTVGLACWTPRSAAIQMFEVSRRHQRQPAPGPPPELWGDEDTVRERLDDLANSFEFQRLELPWEADSPEDFVARMERHAPPQAAARASMEPEAYAALRTDLVELAREWAGGDGPVAMGAEYLVTVARRRG